MRKIGIILRILPSGGGTWQWTINILNAIQDYSKVHGNKINLYYFDEYSEYLRFKKLFPDFQFYRFTLNERLLGSVLEKLVNIIPFTLKILKWFYPLNSRIFRDGVELMIIPGASFDSAFCRQKQVFMFTDIAHVFYPQFPEVSADGELRRRNVLFRYGIANADQIVVDSKQLGRDIVEHYRADPSMVDVLYQVFPKMLNDTLFDNIEGPEYISQLPDQYLFYPAQLWAHKNHANLLEALSILLPEFPNLHLVLSGSRKKGDDIIFKTIHDLNIQERVRYLGYVRDSLIPILYRKAQALVMPTFFGPTNIPTLEAFYYGCPAVISNLPGVTEQTGEAALLFNPNSPEDIADKVRLTFDEAIRQGLISNGYKRLRHLSYENYRDTFFKILDKNLGRDR